MRRFFGILVLILTICLVYLLDRPLGALPAIGRLIDPVNGCLANAEPVKKDFSATLHLAVSSETTVWFDDNFVPHIHAANDHDLFFAQGYLHAYFRLWQMDMQTRAAAGRISEVAGDKAIAFDQKQRRKGMVYAAENSLRAMESEPRTKLMLDAYTDGINSFISSLKYRDLPLEYKLMGFVPEKWANLRTALLLKYMADDLTGKTDDMALTYLRGVLPAGELDLLFPERVDGAMPAIPAGTVFDKPSLKIPVASPDSIAFPHFQPRDFGERHDEGKGSNNWAISGSRTASGATILCNDPHLGLNLPSLWFQVQLQAPGVNACGVSLPGAPGIIIGFNDNISWGETNNYQDVKDFYVIRPVEGNKDKYWFAGKQLEYSKRIECIKVKGKPDVCDTVRYTIHGPLIYDEHNTETGVPWGSIAMCWMGHRATNELLAFYLVDRARNYDEFVQGLMHYECPAQNFAYADRQGNIAIWGQGQFVNKWKNQGKYVMNGSDSGTLWGELIPMSENPHALNPQQGFVASANQVTTDSTYPYWYNSSGFVNLRAWRINSLLERMHKATVEDMFKMQNDVHSYLAEAALPVMLSLLHDKSGKYYDMLKNWDYELSADSKAATVFQLWWSFFFSDLWSVRFKYVPDHLAPLQEQTVQLLKLDYFWGYVEPGWKTPFDYLYNTADRSFKRVIDSLNKLDKSGNAEWYKVKNTTVGHLAKLPAFGYDHLQIGGWGNVINAANGNHGPSWRMVVQMGKEVEAYGIYPGGQSGNPGSKYYADFIQQWADGKYNRLLFLPNSGQQADKRIKYTWKIVKQ